MLPAPVKVDPEVAAAKFKEHLDWVGGDRSQQLGIRLMRQEPLWAVARIPGLREGGSEDDYFVRLGAEYYDKWPPTAAFVQPDTWELAKAGTRWLPNIQCQPPIDWFALHVPHGQLPQLLCFTFTAEYYMVPHSPTESSVWQQGRHRLTATLSRLAEVLKHPHYRGPSGQ